MAYNVQEGDIFKVAIYCADATQESVNTLNMSCHYLIGVGGVSDQDMVDQMGDTFGPVYRDLMSSQARFRGVTVRRIHPAVAPVPVTKFTTHGAGAGTDGTVNLPNQATGLLSLRTDFGGPRLRGRIYIPFPSADANELAGVPTAVYQANVGTLGGLITAGFNANTGVSVVQLTFGAFIEGAVAYQPYIKAIVGTEWATQIRRSNYRRKNTPPF